MIFFVSVSCPDMICHHTYLRDTSVGSRAVRDLAMMDIAGAMGPPGSGGKRPRRSPKGALTGDGSLRGVVAKARVLPPSAAVGEEIARACGATAMVSVMPVAAAKVMETSVTLSTKVAVVRARAQGQPLTPFALSERGSRAQCWAPVSALPAQGKALPVGRHPMERDDAAHDP